MTRSDPAAKTGDADTRLTSHARPQPKSPGSDRRSRARAAITIVGKPRISVDESGTHITFDVANKGPVRLDGSVGIDINGHSVTLRDPTLTLTAESGPITVSYDLADSSASVADRVTVVIKDSAGRALTTSTSATTIGIGTTVGAVTVAAGLGWGGVALFSEPEPEPEPNLVSEVAIPSTITARHDAAWKWPLGEPDAVRLTMGPSRAAGSADDNLRVVRRTVRADYGSGSIDLGTIQLVEAFPTPDSPGGSWPLGEVSASGVDMLRDGPVAVVCHEKRDPEKLTGGYLANGPGDLTVEFFVDLTDTGSTSWRARVAWTGPSILKPIDGVGAASLDGCPDETEATVTWTAGQ